MQGTKWMKRCRVQSGGRGAGYKVVEEVQRTKWWKRCRVQSGGRGAGYKAVEEVQGTKWERCRVQSGRGAGYKVEEEVQEWEGVHKWRIFWSTEAGMYAGGQGCKKNVFVVHPREAIPAETRALALVTQVACCASIMQASCMHHASMRS